MNTNDCTHIAKYKLQFMCAHNLLMAFLILAKRKTWPVVTISNGLLAYE